MADFTAQNLVTFDDSQGSQVGLSSLEQPTNLNTSIIEAAIGAPQIITYYMMRWLDVDCVTPTYRVWVVTDTPDPTGTEYVGTKCGGTAISGAVIAATWQV